MSEAFAVELDAAFDLALARAMHANRASPSPAQAAVIRRTLAEVQEGRRPTMPTTASTSRLDLAVFWWTRGLAFHRCIKADPWSFFEFLDPDDRAPGLAEEYRRVQRRLLYALRVADLTPGGVVTLFDLDHPRPGLRRDLRATDRRTAHAGQTTEAR